MSILSLVAINRVEFLLMICIDNYCNCEHSSLGGFPLKEASEHEWIPSIKGSTIWCCSTLRVLINYSGE